MKVGWTAYDAKAGFGWSGPNIGKPDIMLYQYLADAPGQRAAEEHHLRRLRSHGHVRVRHRERQVRGHGSIGWSGKTYSKQRVVVEGKVLYDDVETSPTTPYRVQSVDVDVADGNVTLEVGQKDEYTMLNWMSIVPK